MPGLNKKGPLGQGPLSGGQQGLCVQNNETDSADENQRFQQGAGGGRGGAGCRRRGGSGRGTGVGRRSNR